MNLCERALVLNMMHFLFTEKLAKRRRLKKYNSTDILIFCNRNYYHDFGTSVLNMVSTQHAASIYAIRSLNELRLPT